MKTFCLRMRSTSTGASTTACLAMLVNDSESVQSQESVIASLDDEPDAIESDDDDEDVDSEDFQLQEAFAKGDIDTSRINRLVPFVRRDVVNNLEGLNVAINSFSQSSSLPWFERMDLNNDLAPVAPELAAHLDAQRDENAKRHSTFTDGQDDDFKREVTFYRQAQAAVMEGLARVRQLKIPTRRPDDYFAQMLKSDDHMQKVREVLVNKQLVMERREKARKLREMKKYGKQVQTEVLLRRAKEKRETLDSVKKFRRGQKDKLDFLDDGVDRPGQLDNSKEVNRRDQKGNKQQQQNRRVSVRKKAKDAKYGFGGKKKRGKYNDADSSADVSAYRRSSAAPRKDGQSKKRAGGGSPSKKKGGKNNRRQRH